MRRLLYSTTAFVTAGLLSGGLQAAEPLKLTISGTLQQWFGIVNHEKDADQSFNSFGINTDNEINFKARTLLDNGIEAEVFTRLNVYNNNTGPTNNGNVGLDEQWVALGSAFGKVYAGAKDSINKSLHNQPVDYGIGTGDVGLTWIKKRTTNLLINPPLFESLSVPLGGSGISDLMSGARDHRTSFEPFANQVPMMGYISPQVAGFQLGLTYAPNPSTLGTNSNTKTSATDHWDVTLAYTREFKGVSIGFDGGYAHQNQADDLVAATVPAPDASEERNDVNAWNTGLKLGYAGFTLGGSVLQVQRPGAHVNDGIAWNAGVAYAKGPWGVSYTYLQEKRRGDHGITATVMNALIPPVIPVPLSPGNKSEKFQTHLLSGKYALGPSMDLKSSVFYGKYSGQNRSDDLQNTWAYGLISGIDVTF